MNRGFNDIEFSAGELIVFMYIRVIGSSIFNKNQQKNNG